MIFMSALMFDVILFCMTSFIESWFFVRSGVSGLYVDRAPSLTTGSGCLDAHVGKFAILIWSRVPMMCACERARSVRGRDRIRSSSFWVGV